MHYYKFMLPLVPPAHPDAIITDEEAEVEVVVHTILMLSAPLLAFLLSHICC
jgi:hypothetical protein